MPDFAMYVLSELCSVPYLSHEHCPPTHAIIINIFPEIYEYGPTGTVKQKINLVWPKCLAHLFPPGPEYSERHIVPLLDSSKSAKVAPCRSGLDQIFGGSDSL